MRHREPAHECLASFHIEQAPSGCLIGTPPTDGVGKAKAGDVARAVFGGRQAIEMATILRSETAHERRPPPRHKAVFAIKGAEARKARVDGPQFPSDPGDLVDADIARVMRCAGQEGRVVAALGIKSTRDGGLIAKLPDLVVRTDGEPPRLRVVGQPHRAAKHAEVGIECPTVGAHQNEFASLIGGDRQRDAEFLQQRREIARMLAAE